MPDDRIDRLWGSGSSDALFRDSLAVPTPWGRASRRKDRHSYDAARVGEVLHAPPVLAEVDPRTLRASQPSVTSAGVEYYLGITYPWFGLTFADYEKVANRYPVVYDREDGQRLILSGHHRAAAALLQGRQLEVRLVRGPWGPSRPDGPQLPNPVSDDDAEYGTEFLTPLLTAGTPPEWPHESTSNLADALAGLRAQHRIHFDTSATAIAGVDVLTRLGASDDVAAERYYFALTGRSLAVLTIDVPLTPSISEVTESRTRTMARQHQRRVELTLSDEAIAEADRRQQEIRRRNDGPS